MESQENALSLKKGLEKRKPLKLQFDNSAKFYPVISSKKSQSLFCVGAVMSEDVDKDLLKTAVNEIMARFPSLAVSVEKGYSWHYLKENTAEVIVFDEEERILRPVNSKETNGYMFRLSCKANHIRLDMFHGLCDGTASLRFLKAIIFRYRQLQGVLIPVCNDIMHLNQQPTAEEIEDSYLRYCHSVNLTDIDVKTLKGGVPMRIKGTSLGETGFINVEGTAKVAEVKIRAKEMGVTLTSYIAGVLASTLEEISKDKHPVVLMIPVNLRTVFPSETMRNFSTFIRVVIHRDTCKTLDEFCKEVSRQLAEKAQKNKLALFIGTTVRVQTNWIVKIVPLPVKSFFINAGRAFLRSRQTIIYSNVGVINSPQEMGVEKITINMNVSRFNPQNVGSVTVGDSICFNFTRTIKDDALPETFFRKLKELGVNTELEYAGIRQK